MKRINKLVVFILIAALLCPLIPVLQAGEWNIINFGNNAGDETKTVVNQPLIIKVTEDKNPVINASVDFILNGGTPVQALTNDSGMEKYAPLTTGQLEIRIYDADTGFKVNKTLEVVEVEKLSPCFIATAAYGTSLHEDIDVLRDFRDEYLMTNLFGRTFVEIYYTTSPPIADVIRENKGLRTIVREGFVKPLVYISRLFVG